MTALRSFLWVLLAFAFLAGIYSASLQPVSATLGEPYEIKVSKAVPGNLYASIKLPDNFEISGVAVNIVMPDTTPPSANCNAVTLALQEGGIAELNADVVGMGSTDDRAVTDYSVMPESYTCSEIGENTAVLTVSDAAGNTDTCSATITVTDNFNYCVPGGGEGEGEGEGGTSGAGGLDLVTALSEVILGQVPDGLVIGLDSQAGEAYDSILHQIPTSVPDRIFWQPTSPIVFESGDRLVVFYAETVDSYSVIVFGRLIK